MLPHQAGKDDYARETQSIFKDHILNHFKGTKINLSKAQDEEADPYEAVIALYGTGLPYTPVSVSTSGFYQFLRDKTSYPARSPNTVKKMGIEIADATVVNMLKKLKFQIVHFQMDSTPAKNRLEFIDCTLSFIDEDFEYKLMPLGVRRTVGQLTGEAYQRIIGQWFGGLGIKCVSQASQVSTKVKMAEMAPLSFLDSRLTCVSGTTDMGPGAFQAGGNLFSVNEHVPCLVHGAFNIIRAALNLEKSSNHMYGPKDIVDETLDCCKQIRRTRVLCRGLGDGGLPTDKVACQHEEKSLASLGSAAVLGDCQPGRPQ